MVGLDAAILMNPKVWEASGHVSSFSDPLVDCRKCKYRDRADKLIEDFIHKEINSKDRIDPGEVYHRLMDKYSLDSYMPESRTPEQQTAVLN